MTNTILFHGLGTIINEECLITITPPQQLDILNYSIIITQIYDGDKNKHVLLVDKLNITSELLSFKVYSLINCEFFWHLTIEVN